METELVGLDIKINEYIDSKLRKYGRVLLQIQNTIEYNNSKLTDVNATAYVKQHQVGGIHYYTFIARELQVRFMCDDEMAINIR